MIKITSFTPLPNILIDEYLANGKMTVQEFAVFTVLLRKTYGWHIQRESIKNKDLAKFCNIPVSTCRKIVDSLSSKDLVEITYICPDCETTVTYNPTEYQCDSCLSKSTPYKVYEPKLEEIAVDENNLINPIPQTPKKIGIGSLPRTPNYREPAHTEQIPLSPDTPPPAPTEQTPCSHRADPLLTQSRVTDLKPLSDNVPQVPKETLKRNSLKEISLSERLTQEDPEAVSENFEFSEERENFEFPERAESEEERKEERDFKPIDQLEQNQAETKEPNNVDKFTAGLLATIGKSNAIAEEKPKPRANLSTEKEIKELLNGCMVNGWNLQISNDDNEYIKEMMKFRYVDIEASCADRLTTNRPAIPKLFPKWVLDGLKLGMKARPLTQLEKEAILENELEKNYKNGNGDKVSCRDTIKKLYSVISIVGIMENRYRAVMDWCEWQY